MSSTLDIAPVTSQKEMRLRALADLYEEIASWGRAKYDSTLVTRKIKAVDPTSLLFIVGEAYASNQARLTGVSWFNAHGKLGHSGRNLDFVLRCVGYTLYPPTSIDLECGIVPPREGDLITVYTTDIFPCYPTSRGAPTQAMVADALSQRFLIREFEILQPKVILLLGHHSHSAFNTYLLEKTSESISTAFARLSPSTPSPEYKGAKTIPFLHPSPANPTFSRWLARARNQLSQQPQIQAISTALAR